MEARAITRFVRISPQKARDVIRLIRGKPALPALANIELVPRKAARLIAETLRSAIANAENSEHAHVDPNNLIVREAVVNEGPTMRRFRPRARGAVGRIRKRTSHITVVVSDEE